MCWTKAKALNPGAEADKPGKGITIIVESRFLPYLWVWTYYFSQWFIPVSLHWLVSWVWTRSSFQHNSPQTCVIKKFLYINQMLNYCWIALWVKLVVGSLLCSKRFFSGFSGFPLSSKINKFQFDWMQDLTENHFRVSGASWVNINNNYYHYIHFSSGFRWFGFLPNFKGLQEWLFSKLFLLVRPFKFTWLSFKIHIIII